MKLFRAKRDAPSAADGAQPPRRRRRAPRPDGPRTILPLIEDDSRPSWLPADPPEPNPFASKLDAARERLRREIPPVSDEQ
ncbi:MAG TPA: hypothetical protein VFG42_00380 [Baekduia sp.]|uniref:hypothetical protein n=1 Tax=Baekduia sp. TaxID=2600305 RepID=UPI002D79238B|nr:hypothetical protein [Baekduia sp.]HET6505215.1 hypothetical protein [Baekduia sp.]